MDGTLALFDSPANLADFTNFGPSQFVPPATLGGSLQIAPDRAVTRAEIRREFPQAPGVYGMLDNDRRLVYVGMSTNLRSRVVSYFYEPADGLEVKQYRISLASHSLVWEPSGHELTAQLRELELIRRFAPRFNAKGRPGRVRVGYIYLTTEEAPRFRIARSAPRGCVYQWGPVTWSKRTTKAVDCLNLQFQLRDCASSTPMHYADQLDLFNDPLRAGCLRGEIAGCLAPCAGGCSRAAYRRQIDAARAFLDGQDSHTLPNLARDMQDAAGRQLFERAARLRDAHQNLELLSALTRQARNAAQQRFIYPLAQEQKTVWHVIRDGRMEAAIEEPQAANQARAALEILERVYEKTARPETIEAGDFPFLQMIGGYFRRRPEELAKTLAPQGAIEHCQRLLQSARRPR
ncbi:hypothetical protein [Lignipirellula cremea]|nr:hypothetical protein [Lignipirellula cremea]